MKRSVSTTDAKILAAIARRGKGFVSLDEDRDWLREIVDDPRQQLARMRERGSLAQVAAGRYVVLPPGASNARQAAPSGVLLAAAFAGRDDSYYLGFLSAIVDHRLTDEHSKTIFVAVLDANLPRIRELGDMPVRMTRVTSDRKWFGIERVRASGRAFYRRSDLERTLLDTLDRPRLCGGPETWVRAWSRAFREDRIDVLKLVDHAERWGGSVALRCAFWLRDLGHAREARRLLRAVGAPLAGRRLLDAGRSFGNDGERDRETGLVVNMPEDVVSGWLAYEK
jgi:predicted transcriptional regulator of viral defense system